VGVESSACTASGSAEGGTETKSPNPGELGDSSGGGKDGVIRTADKDGVGFLSGNKGADIGSRGLDEIKSRSELDWSRLVDALVFLATGCGGVLGRGINGSLLGSRDISN
jgi:hypothetical protein